MIEPPNQEEHLRAVEQYRQWKRANSVGFLAWLSLVLVIDGFLRQWLPESTELLILAGVLAIPPAWWLRKAYIDRRDRKQNEKAR